MRYDDPNVAASAVVGIISAILLFVIIVVLQAFFYRAEQSELERKVYSQPYQALQQLEPFGARHLEDASLGHLDEARPVEGRGELVPVHGEPVAGADVRLSGIKVGSVVGQRLDTDTFEAIVTVSIAPEVKLPTDSSAQIAAEGLLGGSYVSIQPGGAEELLAAGDTIEYTQGAVDLMSLIGQAVFGSKE